MQVNLTPIWVYTELSFYLEIIVELELKETNQCIISFIIYTHYPTLTSIAVIVSYYYFKVDTLILISNVGKMFYLISLNFFKNYQGILCMTKNI